jgi:predicted unusual protein kinase regulating ubiquinone biosynthesis (AarF/ABC1/UbiB family)
VSRRGTRDVIRQSRLGRIAPLARLVLRIGGRYLGRSPQLLFASVERRTELRHDLALRSAEEVAEELGYMKGVLMKLGQMASYVARTCRRHSARRWAACSRTLLR